MPGNGIIQQAVTSVYNAADRFTGGIAATILSASLGGSVFVVGTLAPTMVGHDSQFGSIQAQAVAISESPSRALFDIPPQVISSIIQGRSPASSYEGFTFTQINSSNIASVDVNGHIRIDNANPTSSSVNPSQYSSYSSSYLSSGTGATGQSIIPNSSGTNAGNTSRNNSGTSPSSGVPNSNGNLPSVASTNPSTEPQVSGGSGPGYLTGFGAPETSTGGSGSDGNSSNSGSGENNFGGANVSPIASVSGTATVSEGIGTIGFMINLNKTGNVAVTVPYTVSGTSTSGADHTLTNGSVSIPAGSLNKAVIFSITNDLIDEDDETINIQMGTPTYAFKDQASNSLVITIQDNDLPPTVAFGSASSSGSESSTSVNIPVTLSSASEKNISVNYNVTGGSAVVASDYNLAAGTLNFLAGTTTQNIVLTVVDDAIDETNETINLLLSSPTNSSLGLQTTHTYTINDNDAPPAIAFTTTTSSGAEPVVSVNISVDLTAVSGQNATVDYAVTGGTATSGGTDFTLASGTLNINAGQTTANFALTIVDDALNESNETIIVTLSNPTNSTLGTNTTHTYTINDNELPPTIAFGSASSSGLENTTAVTIPVNLSSVSGLSTSVDYSVTGGTATGGATDYTLASGTLTINAGQTTGNITITVNDDALDENNETITLLLSNPTNSTLGGQTTHTYTINDDDSAPTIAFGSASSSGSEGTTSVTVPVNLSSTSGLAATVDYAVTGGTASGSGIDFTLASGTLTINEGQTSVNLAITINDDPINENAETIVVTLSSPTNSALGGTSVHTYTINNNDTSPTLALNDTTSVAGFAKQLNIDATIGSDAGVSKWCISESQSSKPATGSTACTGGTGPSSGWYTAEPATFTLSAGDGLKTVYVWTADSNDQVSQSGGSATITLDTAPPSTPTVAMSDPNSANNSFTNQSSINLSITGDAGATSWCVIEQAAAAGAPSTPASNDACWVGTRPTLVTLGATGSRRAYVFTKDVSQNVSAAGGIGNISYSTTLPGNPTLALTDPATALATYAKQVGINAAIASDGTASRWCISQTQTTKPALGTTTCTGGAGGSSGWFVSRPTTFNLSAGEGLKTVYIWISDDYNNVNAGTVSSSITLDTVLPIASITVNPSNPSNNASPSFTFTTSDSNGISGSECRIDGGAYSACTSPHSLAGLGDASHTFDVRAIDNALNTGSPSSYTWTVDTAPPTGNSISIASAATYTNTSSVNLTLASTGATDMYVTNTSGCAAGGSYEAYGTSKSGWNLSQTNATATVYVKFRDSAGNESACFNDTIIHDNTAPSIPTFGSATPASPSTNSNPLIIGTASSSDTVSVDLYSNAGCGASIGSGTKATYEGAGISVGVASNATTTIYGITTDGAGNASACTFLANYVHDNVAPAAPVFGSTNPASPSSSTLPTVIGTASADTVSINLYDSATCSNNIGTGSKATFEGSGVTVTVSSGTTTTLYIKSIDAAGNASGCTFMANYSSVTPYVTNVTSSTADGTYGTAQTVTIQVQFNVAVTVTGTPQIQLETGTTDRQVNYSSGSGTSTLNFIYTVQASDSSADLDYKATGSLTLNGGTIKDSLNTNAILTLPTLGGAGSLAVNKAIVITTAANKIVFISSQCIQRGSAYANTTNCTNSTLRASISSIANADTVCQNEAQAAGLANFANFVSWTSDNTHDAYCRILGFSGKKSANCGQGSLPVGGGPWHLVATGGGTSDPAMLVASDITQLTSCPAGTYPNPPGSGGGASVPPACLTNTISRTEFGNTIGIFAYTATKASGIVDRDVDWTSESTIHDTGHNGGADVNWTAIWWGSGGNYTDRHIYCFEK